MSVLCSQSDFECNGSYGIVIFEVIKSIWRGSWEVAVS